MLAEIVEADGATVTAEQVIARIDTEGQRRRCRGGRPRLLRPRRPPPAGGRRPRPAARKSGVAMPAAAKLMADNSLARRLGGRHRQGRPRDQGRRARRAWPAAPPRPPWPRRVPAPAAPRSRCPPVAAPAGSPDLGDRPEQRVPMIRLRARVAERLLQSQSTNAILTTFNEVNMAPVMEMRKRFQEKFEKEHGVKIGFMSFFVKAAVHALKKYPVINASVDGNDIVYHGYFDIGIAVGSPRGLVVPILRNADQMSFADIEKKIAEFGQQGARRQAGASKS